MVHEQVVIYETRITFLSDQQNIRWLDVFDAEDHNTLKYEIVDQFIVYINLFEDMLFRRYEHDTAYALTIWQ